MANVLDAATLADLKGEPASGTSSAGHDHLVKDAIEVAAKVPGQPITATPSASKGIAAHDVDAAVEKPDHLSVERQASSSGSSSSNRTMTATAIPGQDVDLSEKAAAHKSTERLSAGSESSPMEKIDEKLSVAQDKSAVEKSHSVKKLFRFGKETKPEDRKENKDDTVIPELDYSHFTADEKARMLAQTEMGNDHRKVTYLSLFKFATKFELLLMAFGLACAVGAGVITP